MATSVSLAAKNQGKCGAFFLSGGGGSVVIGIVYSKPNFDLYAVCISLCFRFNNLIFCVIEMQLVHPQLTYQVSSVADPN